MATLKIKSDDWISLVLSKLGITPSNVSRVVIDAKAGDVLKLYITHYGTTALMDVRPPDANEVEVIEK